MDRLNALLQRLTRWWNEPPEPVRPVDREASGFLEEVGRCADAAIAARGACTCHPDDDPPRPCPRKFGLAECRAAAGVTEVGHG